MKSLFVVSIVGGIFFIVLSIALLFQSVDARQSIKKLARKNHEELDRIGERYWKAEQAILDWEQKMGSGAANPDSAEAIREKTERALRENRRKESEEINPAVSRYQESETAAVTKARTGAWASIVLAPLGTALVSSAISFQNRHRKKEAHSHLYGGFLRRLLAVGVDGAILLPSFFIPLWGAGFLRELSESQRGVYGSSRILQTLIIPLIWGLMHWLYFTLFESSAHQATPGKILVNIFVTDYTGTRISFGRANARYWAKLISALPAFAGFVIAAFDSKKQALHDRIAKCLVVRQTQ
jgi:uncharacterized RDD family membrane protein YckC